MELSSPSLLHANQQCLCTSSPCCREFGETGKSQASGDHAHFQADMRGDKTAKFSCWQLFELVSHLHAEIEGACVISSYWKDEVLILGGFRGGLSGVIGHHAVDR